MRKLFSLVVVLSFVLALGFAGEEKKDMRKIEITGLHCDNCVTKMETALKGMRGVEKVSVDREKGEALVTVSKTTVKTADLVKAVAKAGYTAKSGKIQAEATEKCEDDCKEGEHKDHNAKKEGSEASKNDENCCTVKKKT